MDYNTISWTVTSGVGTLTLNRPERRNDMSHEMAAETYELLRHVEQDDSIAVVVVTGAQRWFCAGGDIADLSAEEKDPFAKEENFTVPVLLHRMAQVTIAAINGACAGAGLGWACACDLRYAAREARFNTAFLDVAVAGDMGLPWTLPRIVGSGVARELSLLPRKLDADEAAELKLVNGVFDSDALLPEVNARASRLAAADPLARRTLKANYTDAENMSFSDFIRIETERHADIVSGPACQEAFRALLAPKSSNADVRPPVLNDAVGEL